MTDIDSTTAQPATHTNTLFGLVRDFGAGVRAHFQREGIDGESSIMIDRVVAAFAGLFAAILLLLPFPRMASKDKWIGILIAACTRLWSRKGE